MTIGNGGPPDYDRAAFPRDLAQAELRAVYDDFIELADRIDTMLTSGEWRLFPEGVVLSGHRIVSRLDTAVATLRRLDEEDAARRAMPGGRHLQVIAKGGDL